MSSRDHVNLPAVVLPSRQINDLDFGPLGAGSGMIGLPGDNTPPSRFVRAVVMTHTIRPYPMPVMRFGQSLRVLDNFNLPLGAAEGADQECDTSYLRSSTI